MKKILSLLLVTVFFTGCAGMVQTGSVSRAYESYDEQDYQKTLEMISFAQKVHDMTPELAAELNYLKAQTYAQLGMTKESDNLFRYLGEQHKNTEYGYLAHEKIRGTKALK